MAVTQADLDQLRHELEAKLASATVEHMNTATAIAAYSERFTAMDAQFVAVDARLNAVDIRLASLDAKIDRLDDRLGARIDKLDDRMERRFNWQTVMFAALGFTTLFGEAIRAAIGI